jgi:hypothetical protein
MSSQKKAEQLGMPHGTASGKLQKAILFDLLKQLNKNYCFQCSAEIETIRELSIEHKIPYLDSENPVKLFFDLDNIAFSHLNCNSGAARKPDHKYKKSATIFKGVRSPTDRHTKFRVVIKGKVIGSFNTALEAALHYDELATTLFGENALTNKKLGFL